MMRNFTIGIRSAAAFGFLGLLVLLVGGLGIFSLNMLETEFDVIVDHRSPALNTVKDIESQFFKLRLENANILQSTPAQRPQYAKNYALAKEELNDAINRMQNFARAPDAKALIDKIATDIAEFYELQLEQMTYLEGGNLQQATNMQSGEMKNIRERSASYISKLESFQLERISDSKAKAGNVIDQSFWLTGLVVLGAFICVIVFAIAFTRALVVPMRQAVSVAQGIANGDLNQRIDDDSKDETGIMLRALSNMQDMLRKTISDIQNASSQLASTSEKLTAVTLKSNQGVESQNEQLEQSSSAVTELSSSIEEVARSADSASHESRDAENVSHEGKQKVDQSLKMIASLLTSLDSSVQGINALASDVNDIGAVLDVIRSIAEQTNLLALNAAIEAARAGDTGRGFAVVADEVRALAGRTQESTQEIEQMIKTLQAGSSSTVNALNQSYQSAQDTQKVAMESGDALARITDSIEKINQQTISVASATEEQAHVSKEVDISIVKIKDLSADITEGARQTKVSSADLAKLAEKLNQLTRQFRI